MEFCMEFVMICMDTWEVWNTYFCVESLFEMVFWFGCSPQWRNKLYRENVGFYGRCCRFFFKPIFLF